MKTPITFLIFNRPDTTEKVFETIRRAKPSTLLVVADGPRADKPADVEKCRTARALIERVDWKCEVLKNYSDINLGCQNRVSSGLDWVFNTVDEAIILEVDCLPHHTFFRFCEELLDCYRNDKRIMAISGSNFQFGRNRTEYSYYFSRHNHVWGWATWKRAWQYYDFKMKLWQKAKSEKLLHDIFQNHEQERYWKTIFNSVYEGKINSWAYRWTFACWMQSGLTLLPAVNLVANLGFGRQAVHTRDWTSRFSNMPVEAMIFPLKHPEFIIRSHGRDNFTEQNVFSGRRFYRGLWSRIKKILRALFAGNSF